MKIIAIAFLLAFVVVSADMSGSEHDLQFQAELPVEFQVEPVMTPGETVANYLKGIFSTEANSYPLYKQCDSRWKNNKISTKTICQVGCLMSSVSMTLAGHGKKVDGKTATPGTLNAWLKKHGGYQGNLFVWGAVSKFGLKYHGKVKGTTTINSYISKSCYDVILNVNHGGHWVLATGKGTSTFSVRDPGYSKTSYGHGEVVQAAIYSHC